MNLDVPSAAVRPAADPARIEALRRTGLLDTASEESFDRLARLACRLLNAPVALISLVDADRQFFKACVGLPEPWASGRGTPRCLCFCRHVVDARAPLVVEDVRDLVAVADDPVMEDLGVVAYAGVPLLSADGHALGSFCVIDHQPRHWTAESIGVLRDLAASAETEIHLREALRESEQRGDRDAETRRQFEELVQGLEAVVWEMDLAAFRFTFVSRRAEDLLGYPVQRWTDEPNFWQDVLLHPDDRDWALDFCQTETNQGRDHDLEYRAVHTDGSIVWLRDLVRVVSDEGGAPCQLRGVMIDVTAEKRTREALQRREAQLAEAQAIARLGSWEWEVATDRISWSDEQYRLHGREPGSAIDFAWFFSHVHPADRASTGAILGESMRTGATFEFPYRIVRGDGTTRWLQARGHTELGCDGQAVRMLGTSEDVTERREADRALRASEARFREFFEQFPASVQILSPDGRTVGINPAYTALWGLHLEALSGFNPLTDPQLEAVRDEIRRGFDGETVYLPPVHYDARLVGPGDADSKSEPRWIEAFMFPTRDDSGGVREVVLVHKDVTATVEAEAALRASEESYRTIFEASSDAIYLLDVDTGAILDVNQAACDLNGYPREEMLALGIGGLSVGDGMYTWDTAKQLILRAAAGEPQRIDWYTRHSSGTDVWGEVTLRRVTILGQERVLASARDITARKAAEEARLAAERDAHVMAARMRAVAGAAAGVIGAETVDALQDVLRAECGKVMRFDAFAMALYDETAHTLAYLEGFDTDIWVPAATIAVDGTAAERVIREKRSLVTQRAGEPETGAVRIGTGRRPESVILAPIVSGGRVLGLLSVQSYTPALYSEQDVEVLEAVASLAATALVNMELLGELRTSEEALLQANEELEQRVSERTAELQQRTQELEGVFRALPDLFFRLSPQGSVLPHRTSLDERLYLAPPQFVGRSLAELLTFFQKDEDDRDRIREAIECISHTGELVSVEYPLEENGVTREFEARLVRLEDGSMIAVARDITDRKHAERELQRREEHFRRLIENAHDFVEIVDRAGTTLYISPAVARILGYAPEEVVGTAGLLLADPNEIDAGRAKLAEAAANPGRTVPGEFLARHKDGSVHALETFARTLAPDSADEGIVINVRDITERKRFEEALQEREARFRRLTENSSDLVQVIDAAGRVAYTGPSVMHLLGYTPDELFGRGPADLVHPGDLAHTTETLAEVLAHPGESRVLRNRVRHRDGRWRVFEALSRTMLPDSAADGIIVNARDITERFEAEQALRDSEARYRSLIENAHDIVTILDLEGRVTYQSPQMQRVLGYAPTEMVGQNALDFVHPDDRHKPAEALEQIFACPGATYISEYRFRHKDGSWRYLETFGRTLVPDTPGQGLVFNTRDVTERREAQRLLQEREQHFRKLIEKSGDMVQLLDATGRITYTGPSVERMLGYLPEEIEGTDALSYIHPEDVQATAAALSEMLSRPEEVVTAEYRVGHKAGHYRVFEAFARTIFMANGEQVVVVNARDVTERREAEAALARQRAYFELLLGSVEAGIAAWDPECRFEYVSTNAVPDPVAREFVIGKTHAEYYAWCGRPMAVGEQRHRYVQEAIRTRRATEFEDPVRLPDGTTQHMLRRYWPVLDEAGEVERVIGYSVDITARKRAEEALQRQREYFEQLLASVDAGIAAWDALGRFEYVSPNGMPDAELREWVIGKTHSEYGARRNLPRDLIALRQQALAAAIETRTTSEYEEALERPDGSPLHLLRRNRPILNEAGEVERVIGYSIDITERKRTEEAVRRATEEAERAREAAERANRAKSEFLSRMSHELRTPMNSILGFAQLLDRAPLPPENKKGVGHILKAGRHLLQLINEVLEIARIEAGRHSLSLEPVRAGTVLQEAAGLVRPLAAQWRVELDEGPWPCCNAFVQADRQRLTQVLLNLLANAIKYNRPGGRVRVQCETLADGERQRLVLRIEDTGRGIEADKADQLFTPFARLGAEQSEVEGTGLGLALSQRLTEAMGGALSLDSTGPEGSVFRLELQMTADPLDRLEDPTVISAALDGAPHAPATLLYIEDNLANLSLVETILLSRPRWRTMPALQGQIGVELAREHTPDLVLLDLHLPDISGEEVLRRLRAEPRTASTPVVVITADATRTTIERLRSAGADAYLTKPLDIDEFLETVERFLPNPE